MVINHKAAGSAIYHIESMERKLKLLKQYINPVDGVVNDTSMAAQLVNAVDAEMTDLQIDLSRFL